MTRIFRENGDSVPVTVIEALPNRVTTVKTADRDGYRAVHTPAPAGPPPQEVIATVVDRYRTALEQRNMAALKAVWPGLSGPQQAAIESDFANARSIEVQLSSPRVTISGTTATVVTRRQYQLRTRDGQQLRSESITTMTLRQNGSAWVIESVRYQPVN